MSDVEEGNSLERTDAKLISPKIVSSIHKSGFKIPERVAHVKKTAEKAPQIVESLQERNRSPEIAKSINKHIRIPQIVSNIKPPNSRTPTYVKRIGNKTHSKKPEITHLEDIADQLKVTNGPNIEVEAEAVTKVPKINHAWGGKSVDKVARAEEGIPSKASKGVQNGLGLVNKAKKHQISAKIAGKAAKKMEKKIEKALGKAAAKKGKVDEMTKLKIHEIAKKTAQKVEGKKKIQKLEKKITKLDKKHSPAANVAKKQLTKVLKKEIKKEAAKEIGKGEKAHPASSKSNILKGVAKEISKKGPTAAKSEFNNVLKKIGKKVMQPSKKEKAAAQAKKLPIGSSSNLQIAKTPNEVKAAKSEKSNVVKFKR